MIVVGRLEADCCEEGQGFRRARAADNSRLAGAVFHFAAVLGDVVEEAVVVGGGGFDAEGG